MCPPLFYQPVILLYAAGVWCTLGFRRATRQDVLAQPVRAQVYDYIKVHPPGTPPFSVIAEKNEINRGTLHYHLYILLREGRVSEWREGGVVQPILKTMVHIQWMKCEFYHVSIRARRVKFAGSLPGVMVQHERRLPVGLVLLPHLSHGTCPA